MVSVSSLLRVSFKKPLGKSALRWFYITVCLSVVALSVLIFLLLRYGFGLTFPEDALLLVVGCFLPHWIVCWLVARIKKDKNLQRDDVAWRRGKWANNLVYLGGAVLGPCSIFLAMIPVVRMMQMEPKEADEKDGTYFKRTEIASAANRNENKTGEGENR